MIFISIFVAFIVWCLHRGHAQHSKYHRQHVPVGADYWVKITHIVDGDTVDGLTNAGEAIRFRLMHLDAPEKGQEFGAEAANALKNRIMDRTVMIRPFGVDFYGQRQLAEIWVDGGMLNLDLVKWGYAWAIDDAPSFIEAAQAEAKRHRRGLWGMAQPPTPPWDFRAAQGIGHKTWECAKIAHS